MRILCGLAAISLLSACGSPSQTPEAPADTSTEAQPSAAESDATPALPSDDGLDADGKAYKAKVQKRMRSYLVKNLMQEHDLTEDQANCLAELGIAVIASQKTSPKARAKVEGCGADPDMILR